MRSLLLIGLTFTVSVPLVLASGADVSVQSDGGEVAVTFYYFPDNSPYGVVIIGNTQTDRALTDWALGWTWENGEVIMELQKVRGKSEANCTGVETWGTPRSCSGTKEISEVICTGGPVSCSTTPEVSGLEEISSIPKNSTVFFIIRVESPTVQHRLTHRPVLPSSTFGIPRSLTLRDSVSSYTCTKFYLDEMCSLANEGQQFWKAKCTVEQDGKDDTETSVL